MSEKDQAQTTGQSEKSYADSFDEGWSKMKEAEVEAKEPTPAKEPEVKAPEKAKESDCPGCDKEKAAKEAQAKEQRTPYRVLKVNGKEVPVYSEQELNDLAQQGVDYTQKRQMDSEDRRKWEAEYDGKHKDLTQVADKFDRIFSQFKPGDRIPGTEQSITHPAPVAKADVYKAYGIDPEYADPFQKQAIDDLVKMRETIGGYEQKLQQVEATTNFMVLKETAANIGKVIADERQQFPFDDIMSEDGKDNLTWRQFASLMLSKNEQALREGRKPDVAAIARESVKDMHYIQSKSKAVAAPDVANDLKPEDFAAKYPDLYKRVSEEIKARAVADYEADKAKNPPSLEARKHEVDLNKVGSAKLETKDDYIDAAFNDPEILAAIRGEK
ncbi:MAG: hypothetical protein WC455_26650 [Dehalococcoidia bacterium]|jgi:hypothetical protein